jgi:hypothetical protein
MSSNQKTMKVVRKPPGALDKRDVEYEVIVMKNSVAYHPGQRLCEAEVDDLCRNGAWDVTIVGSNREGKQ